MRLSSFKRIPAWAVRHKIWTSVIAVIVAIGLYVGISLGVYVSNHSADPFQQNVASWSRDHHLGFIVNRFERWLHSKPPSDKPAESLALEAEDDPSDTLASTSTVTTTAASTSTTSEANAGSTTVAGPTTTAAPTTTLPPGPVAIAPVVSPALKGEGEWRSLVSVAGETVVWATSLRPLAEYGSVVATAAVFDPTELHAGLFNGPVTPGKWAWNNGHHVMRPALPSLVAAFNGGFRFEHYRGGYVTEGRVVRKLRNNEATMAIDKSGVLHVGVWGVDLTDASAWVSIRQNLPPVLMDGVPTIKKFPGTYWGDDYKHATYTYRSAICTLKDGRLMYTAMGNVDINLLAEALVNMGCVTAMQLDINGNWPQFTTYKGFGTMDRKPVFLDKRMGNGGRYLNKSDKDFIALFDPATLPEGVVK